MIARLYDALHDDHARGKKVLTGPTEWGGFYFGGRYGVLEAFSASPGRSPEPYPSFF